MVFDFIIGEKLTTNFMGLTSNYIQTINIERFDDTDANGIKINYNTLVNITKLLNDKIKKTFEKVDTLPDKLVTLIDELSKLKYLAETGKIDDEKGFSQLRAILAAFSFIGYEIYIINPVNIKDPIVFTPATRAYLVNMNDNLCPNINRVAEGLSMTFDIPQDASIPNVIMSFVNNEISIDPVIRDVIGLDAMKEKYEALLKFNAGWQFNIKKLEDFFIDYGYKFIVCTEA